MTLDFLEPGIAAKIVGLDAHHPAVARLCEMGFIQDQPISIIRKAPLGDPIKVRLMNYELCLRKSEASAIQVEPIAGAKSA